MKTKSSKNGPSLRNGARLVQQITIRPVLRQRLLLASLVLILTIGLVMFFNVTNHQRTIGAPASGDYQTRASGNWNGTTVWQKYNGSSWQNVTTSPTSSDGMITILSGHTITVSANVTVDQVVINSGGTVNISSGKYIYTNNGSGSDLTVNGTLNVQSGGYLTENASSTLDVNGTLILSSGGFHQFNAGCTVIINNGGLYRNDGGTLTTTSGYWSIASGGTYQHNVNGGSLPIMTWTSGSTCNITGVTTTAPSNLNQTFDAFTWNCASQSANVNLGGTPAQINGNFTVTSTNASQLQMASAAYTLNVSGNYVQSGGTLVLSTSAAANATMNISSDFTQSGGTFSVMTGNGTTGTVNVSGNWTRTGGTITVGGNSSTVAQFNFNKSGSQTFTTSGATISGNVDFTVNNGSTLLMGNNVLTGRNFTLSSGAFLSLGSSAGITSSGATGNIQSTGTRSFSTGADYIYNGTSAQSTGNGLPATVHNLTLTNSSDVTLTGTVSVSNILTLTSGNLITGANEVKVTNTSATSIQGYSSSSYVVGNLRRTVAGTGVYDFPLGTTSYYELATLTLASATGFTDILGTFTNSNPIASIPLAGVLLSNLLIDKVLTYGYWTMTPNTAMSGGAYSIMLSETGNSATTGPQYSYCVIKRTSSGASWLSTGSHIVGSSSGTTLSAGRSGLTDFGDFCIGFGQYLGFKNATLIAGVDGLVGARYKFPDVAYNVDCWIEIMALSGGATLSSMDNFVSGNGYDEAWQPYINQPSGGSSSILWKLTFKAAGTSTDTTLAYMAITGVDIDGGSNLNEFVEATMPTSYALHSPTTLTVTNSGGNYRASSTSSSSIANIDTGQYQAMFQINYQSLNSFLYRTGAINTSGSSAVRQHSLYFKAFFQGQNALPIKLSSFDAYLKNDKVELNWITSSEVNNDHFDIERSSDGETFEQVFRKPGAGNSTSSRYYSGTDENPLPGISYYRLKQTDVDGHSVYSESRTVNNKLKGGDDSPLVITSVAPNPFNEKFTASYSMKGRGSVTVLLSDMQGMTVFTDQTEAHEGYNEYIYTDEKGLKSGIYFLSLIYEDKKQVQKIVKN